MNAVKFSLSCLLAFVPVTLSVAKDIPELRVEAEGMPPQTNAVARLWTPEKMAAGQKYPLVIYLHGAGAKGDDNTKPMNEAAAKFFLSDKVQAAHPAFVLIPQCRAGNDETGRPRNWVNWRNQIGTAPSEWKQHEDEPSDQMRAAMILSEQALRDDRIDRSRIYCVGLSMGGSGTWAWAARAPRRFAAIVPICGLSDPATSKDLVQTPIWTFHGAKDEQVPIERTRKMVAALHAAKADVKFSEYPERGHDVAGFVLKESELVTWLFAQRREVRRP